VGKRHCAARFRLFSKQQRLERDPALAGALMRSIVMGGLAALERDWPEAPDASPTTTNGTRPRG